MSAAQKARVLAEALPYIRAYHGKTLVIRLGGNAMADPVLKANFAQDVALLRLVGMKPIVVHGGGWRIDELTRQMGIETRRHRGYRVTDERTLTIVEMALGELNQELAGLINKHGGRAVGLNGQDGRFIHARPMVLGDGARNAGVGGRPNGGGDPDASADLGFVGDVESIDVDLIELLLSREFVPVIMPIGVGPDGAAYHINSDLLAGRLAHALHAEKLVLMTNVAGVVDRHGKVAPILTATEVDALLDDGSVTDAMRPRLTAAAQAVRENVKSVHIIDGGVANALLLEVLTAQGVGTAVRSDAGPHFMEDSRGFLLSE